MALRIVGIAGVIVGLALSAFSFKAPDALANVEQWDGHMKDGMSMLHICQSEIDAVRGHYQR